MTIVHGEGLIGPSGDLSLRVRHQERPWPLRPVTLSDINRHARPRKGLPAEVNEWRDANWEDFQRGFRQLKAAWEYGLRHLYGQLWLRVQRAGEDRWLPYGLASCRVVTNAGVAYFTDSWQNLVEMEDMKYHGIGTGSTAEAVGDTALVTELTTQYVVNSTRATGTLAESAANIFRSVATNEVDDTVALREHGMFSNASVGSGTLWDRSVYSQVSLDSGDRLESTYDNTTTAGS